MKRYIAVSAVLLCSGAAHAVPASVPAEASAECAPPAAFAKRFAELPAEKAAKKVSTTILHQSLNPLARENPVIGAAVSSEDLFARSIMGKKSYGKDHTFAHIGQALDGPRNYSLRVSQTNYSHVSKVVARNDYTELQVPIAGRMVAVPLGGESEVGFCYSGGNNPCFSTMTASFKVDQALFEALASADPSVPIAVAAKRRDGTMAPCPLYFAPTSFKATLLSIDDTYAKAAQKRAAQKAKGF